MSSLINMLILPLVHQSVFFNLLPSTSTQHLLMIMLSLMIIQAVMALGALPRFFVSPIFAKWRDAQAVKGADSLVSDADKTGVW